MFTGGGVERRSTNGWTKCSNRDWLPNCWSKRYQQVFVPDNETCQNVKCLKVHFIFVSSSDIIYPLTDCNEMFILVIENRGLYICVRFISPLPGIYSWKYYSMVRSMRWCSKVMNQWIRVNVKVIIEC